MNVPELSASRLLLSGARIVLASRTTGAADLLVEDGRIARLAESPTRLDAGGGATLNLDGLTLFPGFIDTHIHGALGIDTMEASADELHRVALFLAASGVTAWLPTLVPSPEEDYSRAARVIEHLMREQDERPAAARVLGLHYEGPFINGECCGALRPAYFRTYTRAEALDALAVIDNAQAARMMTVAPEIAGGIELLRELRERGWIVAIGHTQAAFDVLERAREAGARHMTHFMNAMSPLHQRAPGPIGWGLLSDDVTCDIIADGIHLDQAVLRLLLRSKTPARLSLISDAVAPAGLGDGRYGVWGETITVTNGRTSNAQGSIAGSVIMMREAVWMMLSLGVMEWDAALMAAGNPARLLGVADDYGSIEEGKRADLAALDAAGRVRLTLVGGRIAFNSIS